MERCKECGQELPKKEFVKIVSRYDEDFILFQSTKTTIKETVEEAVLKNISLENANLENANLENANLKNAKLENANLEHANLKGANLEGANLEGAKTNMCIINFEDNEYEQAKQFIEGLKL